MLTRQCIQCALHIWSRANRFSGAIFPPVLMGQYLMLKITNHN